MVDHTGSGYPPDQISPALRRARATRISIEGNAHFCRGLLHTRYPDTPSPTASLIPLSVTPARPTASKESIP